MTKNKISVVLLTLTLLCVNDLAQGVSFAATDQMLSSNDVNRVVNMLTSSTSGLSYIATSSSLNGVVLPLSFLQTPAYFGKYVCGMAGNNCRVTDEYNSNNYSVIPLDSDSGNGAALQAERIGVANGTDIYDAATWEIALSIAAANNIPGATFSLAQGQNKLLYYGFDGNDSQANPIINTNRANWASFGYGSGAGLNANQEYFFKMLPKSWLSRDPLATDAKYSSFITDKNFPTNNPAYQSGVVSWLDWRPITGENAWAFLIAPLQSLSLEYSGQSIPVSEYYSHTLQDAIGIITAVGLLQSKIGAIYYVPSGTLSNAGGDASPYQVSIENNASMLSGLLMLKHVLDNFNNQASGTVPKETIDNLNAIIFGGVTNLDGITNDTDGIISFFKNYAFNPKTGLFYQEGHANDPAQGNNVWAPGVDVNGTLSVVDVNTWTLSLLAPLVDTWNFTSSNGKPITSYQIWQNVKKMGGFYGPDNTLWGVGYSSADGNGYENTPEFTSEGILSGEWTAGAINMIYTLEQLYKNAPAMLNELKKDELSMKGGLMAVSTDEYANETGAFLDIPANYNTIMPISQSSLGFLYANKRYYIPFGWFANPLPSTCSTSWALMVNYKFNPFVLNGLNLANITYFNK